MYGGHCLLELCYACNLKSQGHPIFEQHKADQAITMRKCDPAAKYDAIGTQFHEWNVLMMKGSHN